MSLADIRLRFLQLKLINRQLSQLLLMVDLCTSHPLSLGQLLSDVAAPLLFYDVKISFLHAVLNTSTRRSLEQAPPEIKMDPLESVAGALYVVVDLWSLCHSRLPSPPLPSPPPRSAQQCCGEPLLPGRAADVERALAADVCASGQWRGPHVRLQCEDGWGGGARDQ